MQRFYAFLLIYLYFPYKKEPNSMILRSSTDFAPTLVQRKSEFTSDLVPITNRQNIHQITFHAEKTTNCL
jgi:hypothetical protein